MAIRFFSEDIAFKLAHPRKTSSWIKTAAQREKHSISELNYIFCSDAFLLTLNQDYLNHHTLTDIITFDYSEEKKTLSGDIFISVPRVEENAIKFKISFDTELHRVIIHGLLHLIGYSDKNSSQKAQMRKKEEAYLSLR